MGDPLYQRHSVSIPGSMGNAQAVVVDPPNVSEPLNVEVTESINLH
jgi:hypothetical protein